MEKFTFFYRSQNPFSNWYPASFEVKGIKFNCSEQYMMYAKAMLFGDKETAKQILKAEHPREQKALGRKVQNFDAKIWSEQAKKCVYEGCYAKFTQNENLKLYLLKTAGTTLVEASPTDTIWGIGLAENDPDAQNRATWRGTNWLGEVLTQLREDLLKERI